MDGSPPGMGLDPMVPSRGLGSKGLVGFHSASCSPTLNSGLNSNDWTYTPSGSIGCLEDCPTKLMELARSPVTMSMMIFILASDHPHHESSYCFPSKCAFPTDFIANEPSGKGSTRSELRRGHTSRRIVFPR